MDIEELLTHTWNYLWFDKICNRNKNSDKLLDKLVRDGILTNLNEKNKSEVSCILNNFIKVVKREDNTFYFNSMKSTFSVKTIINGEHVKNKCGYKQTMYVMNCLEDCGYISRERGYRYSKKKVKQGMVIISKPFERIILEFVDKTTQSNEKEESEKNVLIITNSANNKRFREIKLGEKMLAASIINNVLKYNKFLGENVITYGDDIMLTTWLCRIFKDNMQTHGRIYNLYQKVNYQTMSKMDRKTIKINGKPTVELDYKHLHPSILYELVGLEYLLDIYDADVHPSEYFDISNEYPQPNYKEMLRKLVKEILLRMINTSSRKLCLASIVRLLDEDAKKEEPFRDFIGVKNDHKFVANSLLARLEEIHFPIEEYFYNESSVILMNHDSNILMHILNDCMEEKIVALPLHDSVVVNVEVKDKVKAIMMDAFKRELGSNANCKVDEK